MIRLSLCFAFFIPLMAYAQDTPRMTNATVMKVVSGDTIRVQYKGDRKWNTIRLIGLEAPRKASRDEEGQEPWGARAQQFLSLLSTRKVVRVEYDIVRAVPDEAGMIWGYVWLGDQLLNEVLLREGHALLATQPLNVQYVERLQTAAKIAREKQRGIWDPQEPLPEPPALFAAKQKDIKAGPVVVDGLESWVEDCLIGNRKSKIYHIRTGRYYEGMKTSKDAVFFRNAEEAIQAGYKQATR